MTRARSRSLMVSATLSVCCVGTALGEIVRYESFFHPDPEGAWTEDVGSWSTIDFVGFESGFHLTNQYSESHGVTFVDQTNFVTGFNETIYPNDGWGLQVGTLGDYMEFVLDEPITSIAFEFPGGMRVQLWMDDELVDVHGSGLPGSGNFYGLTSSVPFDRVRVDSPGGLNSVDDIHIGAIIPAPGVLIAMIAGSCLAGASRRRS